MTYQQVLENARTCIGPYCKACNDCNGKVCRNTMPGPGAKGEGTGFIRNAEKWREICVNMDTICENSQVDTSFTLFGRTFEIPAFAAPVGAMRLHYGDKYDDLTYNDILVRACANAGILAFTGDGTDPKVVEGAAAALKANGGCGVPTIKPWDMDTIREKFALVQEAEPFAIAMDIDAAGLPFLQGLTPPAGSKSVEELKQIVSWAQRPFILKGIMTARGAEKALEAGASGIVVSNHGGRVLDHCPATAEVLPDIVDAVGGKLTIFVDGAIRCSSAARLLPPSMAAGKRACNSTSRSSKPSLLTRCACAARTRLRRSSAPCCSASDEYISYSIALQEKADKGKSEEGDGEIEPFLSCFLLLYIILLKVGTKLPRRTSEKI